MVLTLGHAKRSFDRLDRRLVRPRHLLIAKLIVDQLGFLGLCAFGHFVLNRR